MKRLRTAAIAILFTTALPPVGAAPEGVRIVAVVTDHQGRHVAGLTARDFELREDGVVQKIDQVEPRRPGPRQIAFLLDEFHVSPADSARVRDGVAQFLSSLRADDSLVVL
ncbi:MAG TPA: hypothetical protein VEL79_17475, partial [Vicinamibacterales bacterium]|nr:hypothetical protein [Vicinamibacterales bacterium]